MKIFPCIGYSRIRMEFDGEGVTTLVCAQGCPLRCKYCLNPHSSIKKGRPKHIFTARELYETVKIDSLYFRATGGGVTFGGGEPLLYAPFIKEFAELCKNDGWKISIETSLSVNPDSLRLTYPFTELYIVDIKDTNPEIYKSYIGVDIDKTMANLKELVTKVGAQHICVRLPLIPGYNTEEDVEKSEKLLSNMGITKFDKFEYVIRPIQG